jgi:serine kinase of HPr protein (carbohydrate metabolism regulator)
MTVKELLDKNLFNIVNHGDNLDSNITKPFCCDLLSIAMSKASAGVAWVTVMGNVNTIAVAVLTDAACIILAENVSLDEIALEKAKQQGVTVLQSKLPVFETADAVFNLING